MPCATCVIGIVVWFLYRRLPRGDRAATATKRGLDRSRRNVARLAALFSIDAFAGGFLSRTRKLDILINNAAIMASPLMRDARGYEAQFATNHLGHFQLTARLWPALKAANGARVVSLSSIGHRISLPLAVRYALACTARYRLPETTRWAHRLASGHEPGTA